MKKIFLCFTLISFLLVGCKSTKNANENLPPESQTESSEQVTIDEVPPVEDILLTEDILSEDVPTEGITSIDDVSENMVQEPTLEEIIEEQGDLTLPFSKDFDSSLDDFTSSDEFFYGEDFLPDEQITENHGTEKKDETFLPDNQQDEEIFADSSFDSTELSTTEENILVEENNITEETSLTEESSEKEIAENIVEHDNSPKQENFVQKETIENENFSQKIASQETSLEPVFTNPVEEKKVEQNAEPITRKEIIQIVEDILSKNNDDKESSPETKDFEVQEDSTHKIVPSRTVYVAKNQTLLVPYPGSGWVYLGELESQALVGFRGKSFADEITNFKFLPQKEGRTLLHFYKLDAISGKYIDDYLEVVVVPSSENNSSFANVVTSPEFTYDMYLLENNSTQNYTESNDVVLNSDSNSISENSEISNNQQNLNDKQEDNFQYDKTESTGYQSIENEKEDESVKLNKELAETEVVEEEPELLFLSDFFDDESTETELADSQINDEASFDTDLLEQAKTAYEDKDYENALSLVNKFLELSNFSIDEALFLKGQILEKPFVNRNIRDALSCYKKIISDYPQSDLWDKPDERIKYIQRFYFNIR